jgi:hypothetical protein
MRASLSVKVRAALSAYAAAEPPQALGVGGRGALEAFPWLAGVPVDIVAREALRVFSPGVSLAISLRWQQRLVAAGRQLDRYANFGAGGEGVAAEMVIDLAAGDWVEWLPTPPRSLGAIAVCARRLAHRWRYHDRVRRGRRGSRRG